MTKVKTKADLEKELAKTQKELQKAIEKLNDVPQVKLNLKDVEPIPMITPILAADMDKLKSCLNDLYNEIGRTSTFGGRLLPLQIEPPLLVNEETYFIGVLERNISILTELIHSLNQVNNHLETIA